MRALDMCPSIGTGRKEWKEAGGRDGKPWMDIDSPEHPEEQRE